MTDDLALLLEALSDDDAARRAARHTTCLRGIRGVPTADIARIAVELFAADPPRLPDRAQDLNRAFGTAWEDGLVAIGLLATCVGDDPEVALDLGLDWARRTDDVATADAIGWLLLAPGVSLTGRMGDILALRDHHRPETRRAGMAAALGWTPTPVGGPSAAPLREKLGMRQVRMVDVADSPRIATLCTRFVRDEAPAVRKILRRTLRLWASSDAAAVVAWDRTIAGGLPRLLRAEVTRAQRSTASAT